MSVCVCGGLIEVLGMRHGTYTIIMRYGGMGVYVLCTILRNHLQCVHSYGASNVKDTGRSLDTVLTGSASGLALDIRRSLSFSLGVWVGFIGILV
jgi:hypothetical protein